MSPRSRTAAALGFLALGLAVGLTVAGPLSPPAGAPASTYKTLADVEPRIAVNTLPGSADAQHVISTPGSYYLTANIVGVSGKHGIRIDADHVTLDLNGFALTGVAGSFDGINAGSVFNTLENLSVFNGTVALWGRRGVNAEFSSNAHFRDLRLQGNATTGLKAGFSASIPTGPTVSRCVAQSNGAAGIHVENGVVDACVATHNAGRGIVAFASAVTGSTASFNGLSGFEGSGTLADSIAAGNAAEGIRFGGAITACRASNNGPYGIYATDGSTVTDCRVSLNSGPGIYAENGSTVRGCTVRQNGGHGLELASACLAESNACSDNALAGLFTAGTGNRVDSNAAVGNQTGFQITGAGNWIVRNSATPHPGGPFVIGPGNDAGPAATAAGATSPWANLTY